MNSDNENIRDPIPSYLDRLISIDNEESDLEKAIRLSLNEESELEKAISLSLNEESELEKAISLSLNEESELEKAISLSLNDENYLEKAISLTLNQEKDLNQDNYLNQEKDLEKANILTLNEDTIKRKQTVINDTYNKYIENSRDNKKDIGTILEHFIVKIKRISILGKNITLEKIINILEKYFNNDISSVSITNEEYNNIFNEINNFRCTPIIINTLKSIINTDIDK